MDMLRMVRPVAIAMGLVAGTTSWAAPAQAPSLVALAKVEKGQWQLVETGGPRRMVCLSDATMLLQLHNRGANCSRFVIDNTPGVATVHYTCPGAGHGRTTVTVETPRLVRVQSQGLDAGKPFDQDIEGRHVGACR